MNEEGIALRTAKGTERVALRGVKLGARVEGLSVRAVVEQTFVNLEADAIEAWYTFPLPEGAAVCGFEVVFFDRIFTGVVEETEAAIERYEEAVSRGDGAYMVERHRPDVFSVRVGNLKPRQAVTVRISYVMDLEVVDRSVRLAFPTTVAPRFVSASGMDPVDAAIEGDAMNPPHVLGVPYGLTMEVVVDLGRGVEGVSSSSHAVVAERGAAAAWTVRFAGGMAEMDRDVVLEVALAKEQEPFAVAVTSAGGEKFVAVSFVPEFEMEDYAIQTFSNSSARPSPRPSPGVPGEGVGRRTAETVFVLDCSGSMMGASIAQATAALECCLRAMSPGDVFNVCRFGSRFDFLSFEPLVYSASTLDAAVRYVRQSADLGGTELMAPLEAVLRRAPAAGGGRNVVLLTDGQVSNEPAIIALAKRHRGANRFFTFGIGSACSQFLVKGLARVTGGAAEFIAEGERIEEKVLRTFGRLASPPVTDVEVDWGNADAQVAPRVLGPIFDGDALRVFARVMGRAPERVTLRCRTAAGPREWAVAVRESAGAGDVLPALWARATIRSVEEEDDVRATAHAAGARSPERMKLVEISKRYGVLCALTSFVAVEHRSAEDRNEGRPALRRVPVMVAKDWGGVVASMDYAACSFRDSVSAAAPAAAGGTSRGIDVRGLTDAYVGPGFITPGEFAKRMQPAPPDQTIDKTLDKTIDRFADSLDIEERVRPRHGMVGWLAKKMFGEETRASFGRGGGGRSDAPRAADVSHGGDFLFDLLAHQAADGSFENAPVVDHAIDLSGVDRAKAIQAIDKVMAAAGVEKEVMDAVRQTLLVLIVLTSKCAGRKASWRRAHHKAVIFVRDTAGLGHGAVDRWVGEGVAQVR